MSFPDTGDTVSGTVHGTVLTDNLHSDDKSLRSIIHSVKWFMGPNLASTLKVTRILVEETFERILGNKRAHLWNHLFKHLYKHLYIYNQSQTVMAD